MTNPTLQYNARAPRAAYTPGSSLPRGRSKAFVASGLFAIVFTAITTPLGLLDWFPLVSNLRGGQGAVGAIAVLVLTVSLWVVVFAGTRYVAGSRDRRDATVLGLALLSAQPSGPIHSVCNTLMRHLPSRPNRFTLVQRRLTELNQLAAAGDDEAGAAVAAYAELDHAHSDVTYGPARALVWALPALGFLGTAAEMSRAVGGLSSTVGRTTDYENLRDALVSDVIPPLANAFGVTLFALGASVVCHLLLTWINAREQRILLEVEEVMLDVLACVVGTAAPAPSRFPYDPRQSSEELIGLTRELSSVHRTMRDSMRLISALGANLQGIETLAQLGTTVSSVDRRLEAIHSELSQDFVVSRQRRPFTRGELPR